MGIQYLVCLFLAMFGVQYNCGVVRAQPALAYGRDVLDAAGWQHTITPTADRVSVTWTLDSVNQAGESALAHINYYDVSDVTIEKMRSWIDQKWLSVIFSHYKSWEILHTCHSGGLFLYEMKVVTSYDSPYVLDYWVDYVDSFHFADFLLTFPADSPKLLAEYARKLFPALPTCAKGK